MTRPSRTLLIILTLAAAAAAAVWLREPEPPLPHRTTGPATVPTSGPADPGRWMHAHLDALGGRTLSELVLPASHDSAMYLTGFPQSLARTQDLTIHGQLAAGVRYFDLRPRCKAGVLDLHHGPVAGPPLAAVLADVRRFMRESPGELVVLKFSHYDGFDSAAYASLARAVASELGPWLFTTLPPGERLARIPLGDYVRDRGVVLVVCDGDYPVRQPTPGLWVYRDWDSTDPGRGDLRVYDQYSDTTSLADMRADQGRKFAAYDGRCRGRPDVACDLFLLSWTLTPPTGVPRFAAAANAALAGDLRRLPVPNAAGRVVNLLYVDCAGPAVTAVAVEQNLRLIGR